MKTWENKNTGTQYCTYRNSSWRRSRRLGSGVKVASKNGECYDQKLHREQEESVGFLKMIVSPIIPMNDVQETDVLGAEQEVD